MSDDAVGVSPGDFFPAVHGIRAAALIDQGPVPAPPDLHHGGATEALSSVGALISGVDWWLAAQANRIADAFVVLALQCIDADRIERATPVSAAPPTTTEVETIEPATAPEPHAEESSETPTATPPTTTPSNEDG